MCPAAREPDVHIGSWIGVAADQPENACFVFFGLRDPIDQRSKFHGRDLHAHSELLQVILNQGGHLCAVGVGRAGQNGKLDWVCARIHQDRLSVR